jgi:transposase
MGSRVELFELIRRDREREGLSIRALAARHGVHRRAVRQALASPWPPPRKAHEPREAPKLGAYRALIDEWLVADREAPRKQRHTAHRVWQRLVSEHGVDVSERQVRRYVRARRRELGLTVDEVFVPMAHEPGVEAEVDWGEAEVRIAGQRRTVHLFLMRACYSGAAFVIAFERESQQAFLEAHVEAFRFFDGVFALIRYDNLSSAVKQVLRGRRRAETDRFVALRSHYLFESVFTRKGREGAHEKGGVEGEVGRFRRNHLVPVPRVGSLSELNDLLEDACFAELNRRIAGRAETVGQALQTERRVLRELPFDDYDTAEHASPRVDAKALATVRLNRYSVPVALAGLRVQATIGARELVFFHNGRPVARHARLPGRFQTSAQLDHYLELLRVKPGALKGSLPLKQERAQGRWPACFDELWGKLEERYGASEAARQMVDVVLSIREHGRKSVELAVRGALAAGAHDGRAVSLLARREGERPRQEQEQLFELPARLHTLEERTLPSLGDYDALLSRGSVQ